MLTRKCSSVVMSDPNVPTHLILLNIHNAGKVFEELERSSGDVRNQSKISLR